VPPLRRSFRLRIPMHQAITHVAMLEYPRALCPQQRYYDSNRTTKFPDSAAPGEHACSTSGNRHRSRTKLYAALHSRAFCRLPDPAAMHALTAVSVHQLLRSQLLGACKVYKKNEYLYSVYISNALVTCKSKILNFIKKNCLKLSNPALVR